MILHVANAARLTVSLRSGARRADIVAIMAEHDRAPTPAPDAHDLEGEGLDAKGLDTKGLDTEALIDELSDLTLPYMWRLRQDAVRAFEGLGVRPFMALLLELIAQGLRHPKELAEVLDAVPPTISAMLGDLEQRGWIRRKTDPDDRRRVRLELTPAGEAMRDEMRAAWRHSSRTRFAGLSRDDLAALVRLYRKLAEH